MAGATMKLADFTAPELIMSPLTGLAAKSVLDELWRALKQSGKLPGAATLSEELPGKVLYGAVEMSGWALLHLRLASLKTPLLALGQAPHALDWPGCHGAVTTVFLVAAPDDDAGHYLALLSTIARLARDQARLVELRRAETSTEIYQFLQSVVVSALQHHPTILSPLLASA